MNLLLAILIMLGIIDSAGNRVDSLLGVSSNSSIALAAPEKRASIAEKRPLPPSLALYPYQAPDPHRSMRLEAYSTGQERAF